MISPDAGRAPAPDRGTDVPPVPAATASEPEGREGRSPPWDAFADYRDLACDFGTFCRRAEGVYEVMTSDSGYEAHLFIEPPERIPVRVAHLLATLHACRDGRISLEDGARWAWVVLTCETYDPFPLGAQSTRLQDAARVALRRLADSIHIGPPGPEQLGEMIRNLEGP